MRQMPPAFLTTLFPIPDGETHCSLIGTYPFGNTVKSLKAAPAVFAVILAGPDNPDLRSTVIDRMWWTTASHETIAVPVLTVLLPFSCFYPIADTN